MMNPEKQRIAIAEFCGWRRCHAIEAKEHGITICDRRFDGFKRKLLKWDASQIFGGWALTPGRHQIDIDESNAISTEELLRDYDLPKYWRKDGFRPTRTLPRYEIDLNEMYEAEGCLSEEQWDDYVNRLTRELGRTEAIHADAETRAKAFLQTIGKWEQTNEP